MLFENLDGASIAHGRSRFARGQIGSDEPVVREDLDLAVDPLQPLRAGSYRFTTEGVPASRCRFLHRGRIEHVVLDLKYARRLGGEPTALPHGMDAVRFGGPELRPLADALAASAGGALIPSVLGAHTLDAASGDFSLAAPQAVRIDGGALGGRARATISGNVFDLLRSDSLALVEFPDETTPGLLVRCRVDPA
jgi:PmbA protein